jgi:hypothetical protein
MSVRLLVFNNGLQIVGDFKSKDESGNAVIITKPVQLIFMPNEEPNAKGKMGIAFAPFLQYTEDWKTGVSFVVTDILTVTTPIAELVNNYNTTFGSGLVLPPGVLGA